MTLPGYKNPKQALEDATTANAMAPVPDPRIKRTLALASLRNGQYVDAAKYAREALDLGGFIAAHHWIISIAYARLNDASAEELQALRDEAERLIGGGSAP